MVVVGSCDAMALSGTAAMLVAAMKVVERASPGPLTEDFSLSCRRLNAESNTSELEVR